MAKKNTSTNLGPLLLIGTGVVLILVVILGQAIASSIANNPGTVQNSNGNIPRTTLADAKKAYDNNSALFLDVRDLEFYADQHIKGAINIPYGDLETRYRQLDPNRWIITYCT